MLGYEELIYEEIIQNILSAKKSEGDECNESGNDDSNSECSSWEYPLHSHPLSYGVVQRSKKCPDQDSNLDTCATPTMNIVSKDCLKNIFTFLI